MSENSPLKIGLIGSPNCGKTTLFNRLTGSNQTTGNWPGVTVEQKTGYFKVDQRDYELIDLPGVYSLEKSSHSGLDEKIAREFLQKNPVDLLINVVDATSLERQLFLTAQLLHMDLPMVVVLNRIDLLPQQNIKIDVDKLAEKLQCPVIPVSAYHNQGVKGFKEQVHEFTNQKSAVQYDLPEELQQAVEVIYDQKPYPETTCWKSLHTLLNPEQVEEPLQSTAINEKNNLEATYEEELALVVADLYFQFAHDAAKAAQTKTNKFKKQTTDIIDSLTLHRIWGLPIFLGVMYLLFAASIALGNLFLDFFDLGAQALFVDQPTIWLQAINSPEWLIAILAGGIGGGIQVIATFIPIIGALFLLLTILEEIGYMQRAALIMDRSMRKIGLSGQAFVPLVIGLGCNVPAVLATRTMPDKRNRTMAVMMTPFMSCSARLPVYVLFASVFFQENAALMVFSLYLIGIFAAVLTAIVLKKTLLPGQAPPLLMELPTYQKPAFINIMQNTRNKLKGFVVDAGKIIVIVVLILNFFNSMGTDGSFGNENQPNSVLSTVAKAATPIVEPLGIDEENWAATVGLVTGLLAKEVVVGALDALYNAGEEIDNPETYSLSDALLEASSTIPENFAALWGMVIDPIGLESISSTGSYEEAADSLEINTSTLEKMTQHFANPASAYAYLLLVLLYFPCVATLGAIKQELGSRWMYMSAGWSLFLGYTLSVGFYQAVMFNHHPMQSTYWLTGIVVSYLALYYYLKNQGKQYQLQSVAKTDDIASG